MLLFRHSRQNPFVLLFLCLVLISPVTMIKVPKHLTFVERIYMTIINKHGKRATPLLDKRCYVLVVDEVNRIVGHIEQSFELDVPIISHD